MFVIEVANGKKTPVTITPVIAGDYKSISVKRYSFNWKLEKAYSVYKLSLKGHADILGLMSVENVDIEQRLPIRLLSVAKENIGTAKQFDRIAGNLFAFAARLAIKRYGAMAAISLIPKTELGQYYMNEYGFEQAGKSLFMEGKTLMQLLKRYDYD